MSLHPYPKYKDSGLPWLGKIPAHWEVCRNGGIFAQRNETGYGELPILEVSLKTGVRVRDMEDPKRKQVMSDRKKYKVAIKGDIAYNIMRIWQGAVGVAPVTGLVSPAYVVARPYPEVDSQYFSYLFRTDAYKNEIDGYSRGIVKDRNRLYWEDFKRMPSCVPPLDEQGAIADYLDAISAEVRRYIRNRRRLIAVMNEQKQAIINRAVTRGLDPDVPLKPSGVDWLGDIPEHWEVRPLKQWVRINEKELPETTCPDYCFGYIDIGCVETGILTKQLSRIRFADSPSRARRILRTGDTIISTVRTYLRAVYYVSEDAENLVASTGFAVLTPRREVMPEFLGLAIQSDQFIDHVTSNSVGIAYPAIAETRLGTFHLALPPDKGEQDHIVSVVKQSTKNLTGRIRRAQREIDLVREYRTRLIADVVTGKLDVRQAVEVEAARKASRSASGEATGKRTANVHFQRAVFAAEIVHRLHDEPTFGHVKFEKLVFLCERLCGVDTGSTYHRDAAGPYDNRALRSIDSQMKKQKWYEARKEDQRYLYAPLAKAGGHRTYFEHHFANVEGEFSRVVELLRGATTQQCEIVATLYSAWEDLLDQGADANDGAIIEQVVNHWHPNKRRIEAWRWSKALEWMREKGLCPKPRTSPEQNARIEDDAADDLLDDIDDEEMLEDADAELAGEETDAE